MNFENVAVGNSWASVVNCGAMHERRIIEWWDEHPNQLRYEIQWQPAQVLERGMGYLYNDDDAVNCDHISGGHAEGLFEAGSNIYMRFAIAMESMDKGKE